MLPQLKINPDRLLKQIEKFAEIGAIENNGCCRLALSDEDKQGRDYVVARMKELGMKVHIDEIGNIIAIRKGAKNLPPIMTGSHIDTIKTGGRLDGSYGVLAALEVIETLNDHFVQTQYPIAVAVFTNEEGVRYSPDMMGSLIYSGGLSVKEALVCTGVDGTVLGNELERIKYNGNMECGKIKPSAFVELHIEQGPFLEREQLTVGAVENLLGISWQEITIIGESNHAGTTPVDLRHDAGLAASKIVAFVRELALKIGNSQRATCGTIEFFPNQINVIPGKAILTVDLRNNDESVLLEAEHRLKAFLNKLCKEEGLEINTLQLVRFEPVRFDDGIADCILNNARKFNYVAGRVTSGAGHDAQMMSRICPTSMIFVPSKNGISHNPEEYTRPEDLEAGGNVLLNTLLELAG